MSGNEKSYSHNDWRSRQYIAYSLRSMEPREGKKNNTILFHRDTLESHKYPGFTKAKKQFR